MATHNVIGGAFRGATWVSLHNGGGVGWGQAINGGFGLVVDGSEEADRRIAALLGWDVTNGLARRAWARNPGAIHAVRRAMDEHPALAVTLPHGADERLLRDALRDAGAGDPAARGD
jgi:urocanate hydratase